jgi:hypothetical protein
VLLSQLGPYGLYETIKFVTTRLLMITSANVAVPVKVGDAMVEYVAAASLERRIEDGIRRASIVPVSNVASTAVMLAALVPFVRTKLMEAELTRLETAFVALPIVM